MAGQPGLFDWERRYAALSAAGDPLERLALVIDFELFRPELEAALARSDRAKGGRPPYDAVLMFKILVLQTLYTLSDDQTEYQIRDRLSFMRFLGLALEDRVPDAKTVWLYREQLTQARAVERLFERFDAALRAAGYLAMAGQIVDASVIEARRPRLTPDEKALVKAGSVPATWSRRSGRRWTVMAAGRSSGGASVRQAKAKRRHGPPLRSRCRCSATRTTSASIADLASSAASRSPMPPRSMAGSSPTARSGQHGEPGLGRHRLSLGGQRRAARPARAGASVPAPQAAREADAAARRPRQCYPGAGPGRDRACLCGPEVPAWPGHPYGRLARARTKLGLANLVTNMRRLVWFELRPEPA